MDESYLTGEPFLMAKTPGARVLSGSINGEAALTIAVDKLPADSRYAKIMQVMSDFPAAPPAFAPHRRPPWRVVHAIGSRGRDARLVSRRRSASVPGRHSNRHAVPAAAGHTRGHHRRNLGRRPELASSSRIQRCWNKSIAAARSFSTRPGRSLTGGQPSPALRSFRLFSPTTYCAWQPA